MYLLVTLLVIGWMLISFGDCDGCGYPTILCCSNQNNLCKRNGPKDSSGQSTDCFCDSFCFSHHDCCIDYNSTCLDTITSTETTTITTTTSTTTTTTTTLSPGTMPPYNGTLKQNIKLNANFKGTLLNLDLQINPDIPEKLPFSVSDANGTSTLPNFASTGVYNDNKNKASMVVKYSGSNPEPVMGSLIKNGQLYALYPAKSSFDSDVTIEGRKFTAEKEDFEDLISFSEKPGNINQFVNSIYQKRRKRQSASNKENYFVELFLIADYSIYLKYKKWCTFPNISQNCSLESQKNITNYLFLIINLVSLRYFSIINDNFLIRIKTVNIQISSSIESISFIENSNVIRNDSRGTKTINGTEALNRFAFQISNKTNNFFNETYGNYDHATLLTDYKIVFNELETNETFTGHSIFGGMCKFENNNLNMTQSITLVRNKGLFSVVAALSHQLAHSMRVLHDGDKNDCSSSEQYLMAPFINNLTLLNPDHINYFSKCSNFYFESYLKSQEKNSCLSITNYKKQTNYRIPSGFTLDQYCFLVFGTGSKFCQGNQLDICYLMECWDPQTSRCVISNDVKAVDGMDCGYNKKCAGGACQPTNSGTILVTPSANPCYFGDYIVSFTWDSHYNFYCANINLTNAYACYNDDVLKRCCNTCYKIKTSLNLNYGCDFGNIEPSYCSSKPTVGEFDSGCYDSTYEKKCCANCQTKSTIVGCPYGDKENNCKSLASVSNCFTESDISIRSICCYTCYIIGLKYTTNTPTNIILFNTLTNKIVSQFNTPIFSAQSKNPLYTNAAGTPLTIIYTTPIAIFITTSYIPKIGTGTIATLPSYNCPNGDIWNTWCINSLSKSQCNQSDIKVNCCKSCYLLMYNLTTLPYIATTKLPNKCSTPDTWNDWCPQYADITQCQDSYIRANCCVSCSKYF